MGAPFALLLASSAAAATKTLDFKIWAAGGAGSDADGTGGGSGGYVAGTLVYNAGTSLIVVVGQGGPTPANGRGGSGGGYSGVFLTSVSQANAQLIAGSASGGTRDGGSHWYGVGGGLSSANAGMGSAGGGGTQAAGGAAGSGGNAVAGSALTGGKGANNGTGSGGVAFGGGGDGGGDAATYTTSGAGGGYYGGGGAGSATGGGTGGAGSSFIHASATATTNMQGNSATGLAGAAAVNTGDAQYPGGGVGQGGNGNTAPAHQAGGNGAVVYRIDGGAWVTLSYTGANQTVNL